MRLPRIDLRPVHTFFLALVVGAFAAASAEAGGFSRTSGGPAAYGSANSNTGVAAKSHYVDYRSNTFATAQTRSLYGGRILEGFAAAGNDTSFYVVGNVTYKQWKRAKAKVIAKGGNVLAKARSENLVVIYVGGRRQLVSHEVARALARHTPLGTTAVADSVSHVSISGSGYIRGTASSRNTATVRVRN